MSRQLALSIWTAGFLAALSLPAMAEEPSEVDGVWRLVPSDANDKAETVVTRENGVQKITVDGKLFSTRHFTIKAGSNPKQFRFTNPAKPEDAAHVYIYEVTRDAMRIAYFIDLDRRAKEAPEDFEPGEGKRITRYLRLKKNDAMR